MRALILAVLLLSGASISSATEPSPAGHVDAYLQRLAGFGYSGAVLIALNGKIILEKGYGLADRSAKTPITPKTLFDIGSLSKNFTAAAILRLEADGKLSVSDNISKYLPRVPPDKREITIHQLLTQTSGISGPDHGYEAIDKESALRELLATPLDYPPGTKWAYSNAGYVLLAAIVEAAAHMSFQDYLRERIFKPAGLNSTGFWGAQLPPHASGALAKGYDERGATIDLEKLSPGTWNDMGSGMIVSTVEDLYRWQQSLEHCSVVPCAELKKMFTSYHPMPPSDDYYNESYGYGIWVQTLQNRDLRYQHGGDFLAFGAQLNWMPNRKLVIISLCNTRKDLYPVHRRADRAIADIMRGSPVSEPPGYVHLSQPQLRRFIGTYALANGELLQIHWRDDHLVIGADGQDATLLLDGHSDAREDLANNNRTAETLVRSLFAGNDSLLNSAGWGDQESRNTVHSELQELGKGMGPYQTAKAIGTYVGGMFGKWDVSLVRVKFANGERVYKLEWDGTKLVSTGTQAPDVAADTVIEPESETKLVGWNIVTLETFDLTFDPKYRTLSVRSDVGTVKATRVR
ncbi:MAG TPA: serine hydrolase domain-containing protein [Rhizomicrobium sp.]|jgi:CubicO group peptidase (beta-lactamase class C family)|nr:serine hydrolase domain-containing protein [Rhizomicrobium sp.]